MSVEASCVQDLDQSKDDVEWDGVGWGGEVRWDGVGWGGDRKKEKGL